MAQAVLDPQDENYTRELPIATTEISAFFLSQMKLSLASLSVFLVVIKFALSTEYPLKIDDWKADGHT